MFFPLPEALPCAHLVLPHPPPQARLWNTSMERARFSVARPELPLRVLYKPGPVAAGERPLAYRLCAAVLCVSQHQDLAQLAA